jgi:ferrous iron transport protein B
MIGRSLEPLTQWAGFNWKINVAILSSFAAQESSAATIGVLYQQGADEAKSLEERMGAKKDESGFTPLHALAIMVFFALYPPCLATTIMINFQSSFLHEGPAPGKTHEHLPTPESNSERVRVRQ